MQFPWLNEHVAGLGRHRLMDNGICQCDDRGLLGEVLNSPLIQLHIVLNELQASASLVFLMFWKISFRSEALLLA